MHSRGRGGLNLSTSGDEDHIMHRAHRYLSLLSLAAALLASGVSMAKAGNQEHARYDTERVRYYDRDHGDYHYWDDREDRAYRRYLAANHRTYRKFNRVDTRVHRNYWNWRHNNPDRD